MSEPSLKLKNPPIVEAVLDIDCDLPPEYQLVALADSARIQFLAEYPKLRKQQVKRFHFESKSGEPPKSSSSDSLHSLHFLKEDEKQLVQMRKDGYSFNRLAPYASLNDYLPDIERSWKQYVELASPREINAIRLRYINRILLPPKAGRVHLEHYLRIGPRSPDDESLLLTGFLTQQMMIDEHTENKIEIVLTAQQVEGGKLPVVLDVCVHSSKRCEPKNWPLILEQVEGLRVLKNHIFSRTVTPECLNLFQ